MTTTKLYPRVVRWRELDRYTPNCVGCGHAARYAAMVRFSVLDEVFVEVPVCRECREAHREGKGGEKLFTAAKRKAGA